MAKVFHYTVKGHWPFPLDMLHHDQSEAASVSDQALIDGLSADHAPDRAAFRDIEISLAGPNKPNTARWESFGWSIPADQEHAYYKRVKAERLEEERLFVGALAKLSATERNIVQARLDRRG